MAAEIDFIQILNSLLSSDNATRQHAEVSDVFPVILRYTMQLARFHSLSRANEKKLLNHERVRNVQ